MLYAKNLQIGKFSLNNLELHSTEKSMNRCGSTVYKITQFTL